VDLSRNETGRESPVRQAFEAAGIDPPERVVTSGSLNMRQNLLASGRFVTCVPHSLMPFGHARTHLSLCITAVMGLRSALRRSEVWSFTSARRRDV
jgi:hypothetical protein